MKCTFIGQNNGYIYCLKFKDEKMKDKNRKKVSGKFFISVFVPCLECLKVHKWQLKVQKFMYRIFICKFKYKSVAVYVKNKKGVGAYIIISEGTLNFTYVSKE